VKYAVTRKVLTAAKEHKCFAVCPVNIPKGESYINDRLIDPSIYPGGTRTLMSVAWHLGCAPLTIIDTRALLEQAIVEKAKHPTHTGAEYTDA
jgi:hypothetical protein